MEYKASQHLIDVLLKFDFKEITQDYFPTYWKLIEVNKTYDPSTVRIFQNGKITILFDAVIIRVTVNKNHLFKTEALATEQLQSIIYSIIHYSDYRKYEEIVLNPIHLMRYLDKLLEHTEIIAQTNIESYKETIKKIKSINLEKINNNTQSGELYY